MIGGAPRGTSGARETPLNTILSRRAASAGLCAAVCAPSIARAATDALAIAYIGGTADVGFYIADARGYLREEGVEAKFIVFDSDTKMMAPLSTGEVDVASGMINAATYNAVERGVPLRAVADKARNRGVYSYQALVVRKDLYDKGELRDLKDLKGRKFGLTAASGNAYVLMGEALAKAGMALTAVDTVFLSLPQQAVALSSGAIDACFLPEPFLSTAIEKGWGASMTPVSKLREDDVTGVISYGELFARKRPEVAARVMKAYIRGLRDYVDTLKDGHIAGPGAAEIIDILARYSSVKDKTLLAHVIPHYVDPNGALGVESLQKDWTFYKQQGLIKGDASVAQVIDTRWAEDAVKALGPYHPKT